MAYRSIFVESLKLPSKNGGKTTKITFLTRKNAIQQYARNQ